MDYIRSRRIIPIDLKNKELLNKVLELENKVFGEGFLKMEELIRQIQLCQKDSNNNAICIMEDEKIIWFWICFLWGNWDRSEIEIDAKFENLQTISYLKTLIIDPDLQWRGKWKYILDILLQNAKKSWDKQVLLHTWVESPNNSSRRFFEKHGANIVKTYHKKWYQDSIDNGWICTRCWNPCECSSVEMIIDL